MDYVIVLTAPDFYRKGVSLVVCLNPFTMATSTEIREGSKFGSIREAREMILSLKGRLLDDQPWIILTCLTATKKQRRADVGRRPRSDTDSDVFDQIPTSLQRRCVMRVFSLNLSATQRTVMLIQGGHDTCTYDEHKSAPE